MTAGWRERIARTDEFRALIMYQREDGAIFYVDEPPPVITIADEVLRQWGCSDEGLVRVNALPGPLVYDIIGHDIFTNSWVAIRAQDELG